MYSVRVDLIKETVTFNLNGRFLVKTRTRTKLSSCEAILKKRNSFPDFYHKMFFVVSTSQPLLTT